MRELGWGRRGERFFFIKLFIRFLKIKMIQYNKYIIKSHVLYSVARTAAEEASWPVITLYKAHSC